MSLRVNLILYDEQRSGSALNMRSVTRIGSIVGPLVLLLLFALQALRHFILVSQLSIAETQWDAIEPKQKHAIRQASRLGFNLQTRKELDGWAAARLHWHRKLAAVMEAAPASIQLTALRGTTADTAPAESGPPVRVFTLSLDGKTRDAQAMAVVERFEQAIAGHPRLAPLLEWVSVANFDADPDTGDDMGRVFTLQCRFKPLPRKEAP